MDQTKTLEAATAVARKFNEEHGGEFLVVARRQEAITVAELRGVAATNPGNYLAASAFQLIRGRAPTPGELVTFGRLLSVLGIGRRKAGSQTLWQLDATAVERLR